MIIYLNFLNLNILKYNFYFFFIKSFVIFLLILLNVDWLKFIPIFLPLLFSVAFLTVMERKVLAAMQRRRGQIILVFLAFYKRLLML